MIVYTFTRNQTKPTRVLSIDPGFSHLGYSIFSLSEDSFTLEHYDTLKCEDFNIKQSFADYLNQSFNLFCTVTSSLNPQPTHVLLEIPVIQGIFSAGLSILCTGLFSYFKSLDYVLKISLLPNRIPAFFLKQRTSKKSQHVALAKQLFNIRDRLSSHEADSLLFFAYMYSNYFFDGLRKPNFKEEVYEFE